MTTTDSPDAGATVRGDEGASVLGPDNVAIALQNPGAAATDSGSLPNVNSPSPRRTTVSRQEVGPER